MLFSRVHPDDHDAVREAMERADAGAGEYALESRALRADGSVRWTVSRGRVVRDVRGERVRMIGTILDVTEARARVRAADGRRAARRRDRRRSPPEMANVAEIAELADVALRGAAVLGASASGLTVREDDGTLRLHLTRRLADTVADTADVRLPPEGVVLPPEDDDLPHGARRPDRRAAAVRRPRGRPRRGSRGWRRSTRSWAPGRSRRCRCGWRGGCWAATSSCGTPPHVFADADVELLDGLTAQIALSVSRLRADAERDAANRGCSCSPTSAGCSPATSTSPGRWPG